MFFQNTITIPLMRLKGLLQLLDTVQQQAKNENISESTILDGRIAPDMFPFVRQIQIVSDNAKGMASRVAGKEIPKYEDHENTLDELKARIQKTIAYLETFVEEDFVDAASREVRFPWFAGMKMYAEGYVLSNGLPNFFFHIVTAYNILRHLGFDIGKADYMGGQVALIPDA